MEDRASALAVAAAATASAWNTHRNGFVWDDRAAIVGNKDVRGGRALWEAFTHDFWGTPIRAIGSHKSYRPLTVLSFRLNHWISGDDGNSDAWHYHVTNMLVHVGCALLVWRVAAALFIKHRSRGMTAAVGFERVGATLAALLFAVHPIHCDAVASIVGRADLLCTLLSLLAFLSYMDAVECQERTNWRAFVLALVCAMTASLCKELGFTVFGLFLAYDAITRLASHYQQTQRQPFKLDRNTLQQVAKSALGQRAAALVLVTLALTLTRVWINGEHRQMRWNLLANNVAVQEDKWTRVLSYAHIHAWYLWKLVWPRSLCFDYGFKTIPLITTLWDINNLYTLIAYSAVAAGVFTGVKQVRNGSSGRAKSPVVLICIAFGAIPFVPASNLLFPVGTVVAERLLYFPSVGFCLLVGHILQEALSISYKYGSGEVAVAASGAQLAAMSSKTLKDAFRRCYAFTTLAAWTLLLCGCRRSQLRNAEWENESTLFHAALKVSPTNNKVLSNIGKTLLGRDSAQAIQLLRIATAIYPQQIEGHTNLGLAHWNLKHGLFGARHLYKSMQFGPEQFAAAGYFGAMLFENWFDTHKATGFTVEAYHSSPTIQQARESLDEAIRGGSYYPIHFYTRARIAYYGGDFDDAIRFCDVGLKMNDAVLKTTIDTELVLRPGQIYNLKAISYTSSDRKALALETIATALQRDPEEVDLYANAVMLYAERRDAVNGNRHLNELLRHATTRSSLYTLSVVVRELEKLGEHGAATVCRERMEQLAGLSDTETLLPLSLDKVGRTSKIIESTLSPN